MKRTIVLLVALISLFAISEGSSYAQGTVGGSQDIGIVTMNAQNGSGESGSATLSQQNGQLTVTLDLSNGTSEPQPAHIHKGTCANLDPTPAYPLTSVVNGKSVTALNLSLGDLMSGQYAINVHKSAAEVQTYVSCGDLTTMARAGGTNPGTNPGMPSTGNANQAILPLLLALLSLGLLFTGLRLTRMLCDTTTEDGHREHVIRNS